MKMSFSKIPGFNNVTAKLRANPKLFLSIAASLIIVLVFLTFSGSKETQKIKKSLIPFEIQKPKDVKEDKDVGVLVGSVDTKSYVAHIEKQYYDFLSRTEAVEGRIDALEKNSSELRKNQAEIGKIMMDLDKRVVDALAVNAASVKKGFERKQNIQNPLEVAPGNSMQEPLKPGVNLEVTKIADIAGEEKTSAKKYVYLPTGSFVKCTLLTGVYAPANESNPLPVLVSVDEAFYGPNNTKVPLRGAFIVGKAIGDVVSKRALIQIVSFSTVLPNGQVFEHEGNLGYLADKDGALGIPGELIYNTGKQLGLNFLSGFLAGGAEALSQAETSSTVNAFGTNSTNVTGNTSRYAMFSGLAKSAQGMSNYYQKQLEAMVPAVKIESGKKCVFVIQKGVQIEGLEVSGDSIGYIE